MISLEKIVKLYVRVSDQQKKEAMSGSARFYESAVLICAEHTFQSFLVRNCFMPYLPPLVSWWSWSLYSNFIRLVIERNHSF